MIVPEQAVAEIERVAQRNRHEDGSPSWNDAVETMRVECIDALLALGPIGVTREDVVQEERAEIAKFIGWFGRRMNLKGKSKSITTHDLSIMVARGDRAPVGVELIDPKWPVRPEADAVLALSPHPGQPVERWQPTSIPETKRGTQKEFIVAVRRAHSGKVYSFAASYLNAYPLNYQHECPKGIGCAGEGCDDGCPTTGWFIETGEDADSTQFHPLNLKEGDEFLGWRDVPQWSAAPASPQPQDDKP